MSHILTDISSIAFLFVGLLLIFVILLQRGRGGGLAGAFGGAGGQSAFGTKAGDVFTRITIGVFIVWLILAVLNGYAMTYESGKTRFGGGAEVKAAGAEGAAEATGGPTKDNAFESGSAEDKKTPSQDASKTTTTPQKPSAADQSAPATMNTPANPPATKK